MSDETPPRLDAYFENCLYFSLSKLQRSINRLAEDAFAPSGLAPGQAFILMALAEHEALCNGALADLMGLAPSTVTRFVDKLVEAGLARRFRAGRESRTAITENGRRLMPQIRSSWRALLHAYNDVYGREEAAELNEKVVALNRAGTPI